MVLLLVETKVKLGLPITLEGSDYKFTGSVSDIKIVDAVDDEVIKQRYEYNR